MSDPRDRAIFHRPPLDHGRAGIGAMIRETDDPDTLVETIALTYPGPGRAGIALVDSSLSVFDDEVDDESD